MFVKLSHVSRKRKLGLLNKLIKATAQTKVLNIGTEINPNGNRGSQFIAPYPWKDKVSAIKIFRLNT